MKKFDLQIEKYGVKLAVKDSQFLIRHKDVYQTIPPAKLNSITLTKSTSITGAAILLALDNEIDISFLDRGGMPFARIWNSRFGSISTIRRNQLSFSASPQGSDWIKEVISHKIKNQMALIANISGPSDDLSPHVSALREKLARYLVKISKSKTDDALVLANQLRGWEANASKMLFRAISQNLPKDFQFEKRSKRPAKDPFNATLNYCYGILYNKIEAFMIRAGLDPQIGVFHKEQHRRPVLVFDVIEIFRHWAEYPVIEAFQQGILTKAHFEAKTNSVYINQPGRKLIIELFFGYLNEKVNWEGENKKRIGHIKAYIDNFAVRMKNFKSDAKRTSGI